MRYSIGNWIRLIDWVKRDNESDIQQQNFPCRMQYMKRFVAPIVVLAVTFTVFAMSFARL